MLLEEAIRLFPARKEIVCLTDSSFLSSKGVEAVEDAWVAFKEKHPGYSLKKLNVQEKSLNTIITSICYDSRICQSEPGDDERRVMRL